MIGQSLPWLLLNRVSPLPVIVPYYHMVSDGDVPHVAQLYQFRSVRKFKDDLRFFLRHYTPVAIDHVVATVRGSTRNWMPTVHLTFDDGYREMQEIVAPILLRLGVPATFFLNDAFLDEGGLSFHNKVSLLIGRLVACRDRSTLSRVAALVENTGDGVEELVARVRLLKYKDGPLIEKAALLVGLDLDQYVREVRPYLSSTQVQWLLRNGFSIGAHSHDHPHYADLTLNEQLCQTRTSVDALKGRFGIVVRAFAFPHNDHGVSRDFFELAESEFGLKVFFGTGGLVRHFYPQTVERIRMEKTEAAAPAIVLRQYARAVRRRAMGAPND